MTTKTPSINTILKAESVIYGLEKVTGQKAIVQYSPGKTDIYFTPEQIKQIIPVLESMLNKKPPPGAEQFNIHLLPIAAPIILKRAWPYLAALLFAGYITGKL